MSPVDPRFATSVATSVPFTYRDGVTTLQLIEQIKCNLDAVHDRVDCLAETFNEYASADKNDKDDIRKDIDGINQQITEILDMLGGMDIVGDDWNPTKGRYTASRDAMRDMYRELAVYGARVGQLADLTVEQLAAHTVGEVSAVGNYTIFGSKEPRVTNPQTGESYE